MKRLTRVLLWALCAALVAAPGISQVITGVGGGPAGGAVGGTGTAGTLAKFSAAQTLANSIASESGTVLTVANTVNAVTGFQVNGSALNISNIAGLGANCATWLATPSSANLAACMSDETGSGLLVFNNAPTFIAPVLGAATGTSFQGIVGNVTPASGTFTALTGGVVTSGTPPVDIGGEILHGYQANGTVTRITLDAIANPGNFTGRRANNTNASPTTLVNGNTITILSGRGYDGTAYSSGSDVNFQLQAAGTWTNSSHPTNIVAQTTPSGSTTAGTVLTIGSDGTLLTTGTITTGGNFMLPSGSSLQVTSSANLILQSGNGGPRFWAAGTSAHTYTAGATSTFLIDGSYTPASGTGSAAGLNVNTTCNGTSSGTCYGLGVAMVATAMTGGLMKPVSYGTTSSTLFSGYTRRWELDSLGAVFQSKITASATAPGADGAKFEIVCGTNAGSAKLIMYAGTSGTAVTVVDNVGAGVTGC